MDDTKEQEIGLTTTEWLKSVREGDHYLMEELYVSHRSEFFSWGAGISSLNNEDLRDVYQEANLIFYEKIIEGKVQELTSGLKTYLFGIGKYLIYSKHRKSLKDQNLHLQMKEFSPEEETNTEREHWSAMAMDLLETMAEPCKSILNLYYYRSLQLQAIANQLNYKSRDVVKTQKSRCLIRLKEMLEKAISMR